MAEKNCEKRCVQGRTFLLLFVFCSRNSNALCKVHKTQPCIPGRQEPSLGQGNWRSKLMGWPYYHQVLWCWDNLLVSMGLRFQIREVKCVLFLSEVLLLRFLWVPGELHHALETEAETWPSPSSVSPAGLELKPHPEIPELKVQMKEEEQLSGTWEWPREWQGNVRVKPSVGEMKDTLCQKPQGILRKAYSTVPLLSKSQNWEIGKGAHVGCQHHIRWPHLLCHSTGPNLILLIFKNSVSYLLIIITSKYMKKQLLSWDSACMKYIHRFEVLD